MANVKQYIAWAEKRIGRLIVAEGLRCGLLGVVQGPLTLTFKVRLLQPSPAALRRLLGLGPALAQALQVSAVRIAEQPGHIAIELPSPITRTPGAVDLAQHTRGLCVAVGYNTLRRPVMVDLQQHGALFWVGPSRRGKTQSMKATLYALARRNGSRLKYMVLSQKRHDWAAFETACGCMGLVSQPAEALRALTWAAETVRNGGWPGLHLVVVCDDLLNLLSAEPGIADPLAEIASMGAGLDVHLLAGTQEAGSKRGTGGAAVENNATAKILYRLTSAAAGARAAGQADAGIEALSGAKGDALLLLDGQGERIATGWADDREILQLTQRQPGALVAPWAVTRPSPPGDNTVTRHHPVTDLSPHRHRPVTGGRPVLSPAITTSPPPHTVTAFHDAEGGAGGGDGDNLFPLEGTRRLSDAEASAIQRWHASDPTTFNPTRLAVLVFGSKNSARVDLIREALAREIGSAAMTLALAEKILADPDHPRRSEALQFLARESDGEIQINGHGMDDKGPKKPF